MRWQGLFPYAGRLVWLTPEQGGRVSGPPATPPDQDYAATAFVPPETARTGLASFVVRAADRQGWTSAAEASWLTPPPDDRFLIRPGTVVAITEGLRVVAHLHVETTTDGVADQPPPDFRRW